MRTEIRPLTKYSPSPKPLYSRRIYEHKQKLALGFT